MKKLISLFMSVIMLLSITAGLNLSAKAAPINVYYPYNLENAIIRDNYAYSIIDENSIKLIYYLAIATNDGNVVVPSTIEGKAVTELGDYFLETNRFTQVNLTLPEHLEKFGYLPAVKGYIISENNKYFSTVDGVLFNKDKTVLIKYPNYKEATDYTVLNTVKTIGRYAFTSNDNLQNVIMQNGVETIEDFAFYNSRFRFKSFTVPKTVKAIGKGAFDADDEYSPQQYNTKKIPTIYYDGTALEFAKLYNVGLSSSGNYYFYLNCMQPSSLDNFRFSIDSEKKEITIYQYFGKSSSVKIPSTVDDYKVTTLVTNYLFKDNESVKKVTIGSNVSKIESRCTDSSLCSNSKIEKVVVSKSNKTFSSLDGVLFNKKGTKLIAYPPAKKCSSYKIPSSVIKIGEYAFYGCKKTPKIVIPAKTKYINDKAFYKAISLKSFSVSSKNKYFSTKDGVLFNKKKTALESYPIAKTTKTYIVPRSVKTIDDYAFDHCKYLTAVKIPKSVKCIEDNFRDCKKLKKVYYAGTKSDWSKIKLHDYRDKYVSQGKRKIANAKIYYNAKF